MPKYLMFDHGGVLDGEVLQEEPGENDLVLEQYAWGDYQVLKNGVTIVKKINKLVSKFGYEVVFHSKNKEEDQIVLLRQLHHACAAKGITFPPVLAMAVRDTQQYKDVDPSEPRHLKNDEYDIRIAAYATEGDGKSCIRKALSHLLDIDESERSNHVVFDDGDSIINAAKEEGYCAYKIGKSKKRNLFFKSDDAIALDSAIQRVLVAAKQEVRPLEYQSIRNLIRKLEKEILSPVYPNKDRKIKKVTVLRAILKHYKENEDENKTIKDSVEWARDEHDDFSQAMLGKRSTRTKSLLDAILSDTKKELSI